MQLFGCQHCGFVRGVRGKRKSGGACPDCERALSAITPDQARDLIHQRQLARQFRQAARTADRS